MILRSPYVWLVAAALLWSFIGIHTKTLSYECFAANASKCGVYSPLLILFIAGELRREQRLRWREATNQTLKNLVFPGRAYIATHWGGAAAAALNTVLFAWGFVLSEALNVSIMNSGALLLITLWKRYVRREIMGKRQLVAAYIGCLGLGLVFVAGFNVTQFKGTLLGLGCAVTMMITHLCTDNRAKGSRGTEALECWTLGGILVTVFCAPAVLLSGLPTLGDAGVIVLLAVLHGVIPDILFMAARTGPRAVPVVKAVLVSRLNPIMSGFWAWYYLGEVPALLAIIGSAALLTAIAIQATGNLVSPGRAKPG